MKLLIVVTLVSLISATSARAEVIKHDIPAGVAAGTALVGCGAGLAWGWGPNNPSIDKGLGGCAVGMAVGGAAGYYITKSVIDSDEVQAPAQAELNEADE